MADEKISDLTADTVLSDDDMLVVVDSENSPVETKQVSFMNFHLMVVYRFFLSVFSTDGTLAANSDTLVPTQKAAKTYIDSVISGIEV